MQYKYSSISRKPSACLWWRPTKKCVFLIPAVFLCLICLTLFSIECQLREQVYLCAVFSNEPTIGFGSGVNDVKFDPSANGIRDVGSNSLEPPLATNSITSEQSQMQRAEELIYVLHLQQKINEENTKQTVWNLDKFGPVTNDTIVILIQAHRRLQYLKALIRCLENSKYIEQALIVISHGYYSDEINNVVRAIQFARVLQIFFPYSLQTHPNTFPGFSPNDCPHGISEDELNKLKCNGQARNVKSLQVKHHWWWKINMVFDGLRVTREFNGLIFLLEEDHYVFPDLLHVLKLMRDAASEKCPECNLFGLGRNPTHTTVEDYRDKADLVHVVQWNNMGFAFDRRFWSGLNSGRCSKMFCEYNDYNWDFTLAYLSHKCLPHELMPLNVVSPRVFHIGDCGMHFHGENCSTQKSLHLVQDLQDAVLQYLFPRKLKVLSTNYHQMRVDGHNGGWNDSRDIELCKNITQEFHP